MTRRTPFIFLTLAACTPRSVAPAQRNPEPAPLVVGTPSASAAPLPPASSAPLAPTSNESVSFRERPALKFHGGRTLKLQPIAKSAGILALSPDAKSWVIEDNNHARLVTPSLPNGVSHETWVPSAQFSSDGSKLLLWGSQGVAVFDVATGRVLADIANREVCVARFWSSDEIVYHDASKERDARLWHLKFGGAPRALGPARKADNCYASLDGKRFSVESYSVTEFVDGGNGAGRAIKASSTSLSDAGNRYCVGDDAGLRCERFDGRKEPVWNRPTSDYFVFDITGNHLFVSYAADADGIRDEHALVDFDALTVTPLRGVQGKSGSMFELGPDGILLSIGSGQGLYVYDLEKAELRFASHRPLYGNYSFPFAPRLLVAGTDEPMDLFIVDVR